MNNNWSNTALVAYSLLPKIIKDIDLAIKSRVNSAFLSAHLKMGVSNEQLIGEILNLIDEKRKLVNLRFVTCECLRCLSEKEKKAIELRYFKKLTYAEISTTLKSPIRTVFRRIDEAQKAFASALRREGYDDEWFEREYARDPYIKKLHDRMSNDKYTLAKNM